MYSGVAVGTQYNIQITISIPYPDHPQSIRIAHAEEYEYQIAMRRMKVSGPRRTVVAIRRAPAGMTVFEY